MSQKINLTKHIVATGLIFLSAMAFVSCEKYSWDPPKIDLTTPVSYKNEIVPIFKNNCYSCHSSGSLNFNNATTTWTSINKPQYLSPGNPEGSSIYTKLLSGSHETRCSIEDKNKIYAWISQGAINDIESK